ncbi:MAG: exonuclease subunit SbcD [Dehalococcoidia bacterium]|nr:exonuclease subunit SbcD [Dehalococcoidia bacterium]
MRLLHTSDWHVGKMIRSRSRMEEFAQVLDEIVDIAVDRQVDAVLVAGDVFDSKVPPPEAEQLVYETLLRLHFEGIRVVVTAGNHDSEKRLESVRGLLEALGVVLVAEPNHKTFAELVDVPSRDGSEAALVAALPFMSERFLIQSADVMAEAGAKYSRYSTGMKAIIDAITPHFRADTFNVLAAHFMVSGARVGGGEQEITIGMSYAVEPASLPQSAVQYMAFGHVHRPQEIPGSLMTGRYSGSLLQLDFGETEQDKSVVIVDGHPGQMAKTEVVPLSSGRRLVDLHDTLEGLEGRAAEVGDAHLRVFVHLDAPMPGLSDRVREVLPNAVDVKAVYPAAPDEEPREVRSLRPDQQFRLYHERVRKSPASPVLMAAFEEVHAEAALGEKVDAAPPA